MIEPALKRECRREMDIEVEVRELVYAYEGTFLGAAIVTLVYFCTVRTGEPRPAELIDEVGWFPLAKPPQLTFPAVEQALQIVRERLR